MTDLLPFRALLVVTSLAGLFVRPAQAQFSQQGPKLVGAGVDGIAEQGVSVSLSGDGDTVIIGGNQDSSQAGAAWVFTRSGGVWTQQAKLVGADAVGRASQGQSVALSGLGDTAIVGGPSDDGSPADGFVGAAWVFTRSAGVWIQQTKLVPMDAIGKASLGSAASLSSDGNTALIGGSTDDGGNGGAGAAWVFTRSGGVWTQQAKLVGTGAIGKAVQGISVSLSGDGSTAIVGGYRDNNSSGAAWVFTRSGDVWTQQAKLVGVGAIGAAQQGYSVAVSVDGNTAAVGGPADNVNFGAAWVFTRSGGAWTQQAKLVGTGAIGNALQGVSVSLSGDGKTAFVGASADNAITIGTCCVGATWLFTQSDGVWTQQTKLVGTPATRSQQGASVSVSEDGSTGIVGGPVDNGFVGAAWVYTRPSFVDLIEVSVADPPLSILPGGDFAAMDVVANLGDVDAGSSITKYYFSIDATKDASDRSLAHSRYVPALVAGATSTGTVNVKVPADMPLATYFLVVCADTGKKIPESDETNNCTTSSGRVTVAVPDLVETITGVLPPTASPGSRFTIADVVQNIGGILAGSSTTRYYLSVDAVKSANDVLLTGPRGIPILNPGAASAGARSVTVPSNAPSGVFHLLACADDLLKVREADESNNCATSSAGVFVGWPDLITTAISEPPVGVIGIGGRFLISDTLVNQGDVPTPSSTTRYYLSVDAAISTGDIVLTGARSISGLEPGTSSTGTKSVTVPMTTPPGTYYLLACADATSKVAERDETNNCRASTATVVIR